MPVSHPTAPPQAGPQPVAPQAEPPKPRRWILVVGLVVLAGLIAAVAYWRKPAEEVKQESRPEVRTAKVTRGLIQRVIRVTGQTAARDYASIVAPIQQGPESGRPLQILKMPKGGSMVKKGDDVLELDPEWLRDHIDGVRDTVEAAEADERKRQAELMIDWETLQQNLRVAKAEWDKAKLDASASEVRTEIERMLLQLVEEEAAARYKQLLADVPNTQASHKSQLRILQFTTDRHRRHFNRHANDLVRNKIKAPMDGLVVIQQIYRGGGESQQVAEGDSVFPGQLIMKIVNPASMQIEGSVNQSESGDFRVGQRAAIGLDAFPGARFEGSIYSLGALAVGGFRQNYYIRTVPIRVAVKGADPRVIPDLSASMDIAVEEMKDATLAPVGAVREQGGKHLVEVKGPQGFITREVKLGIRSHTHVAVLEGVKPDEEVRLF